MATFTERTRLVATLLVVVSAVIMGYSVDVCHGARDGTFSRDSAYCPNGGVYIPGGGFRPGGPCYNPVIPGHGGGLVPTDPLPDYGGGRYPCFRPGPYHHTPPSPPNGDIPPP